MPHTEETVSRSVSASRGTLTNHPVQDDHDSSSAHFASESKDVPAAHSAQRDPAALFEHCDPACPCGCNSEQTREDFATMPNEELLYDLADLFKVFSDTTRIKILYCLIPGERTVNEIAEVVGATQSAVSHQLRTLKASRLVRAKRDGKNVRYSLSDDHVYTMLAQGMTHICE